jgi:UDP-2,3-diacylglucosamine pyrophosphatase LpxH
MQAGRRFEAPAQGDVSVVPPQGLFVTALSWESVKGARMVVDAGSEESPERRFRTLFISDVHLGARGSQADKLLDFLRTHDADTIYLVGDIVDGWALKSSWHWPQSHNDFVQKMLRKARKGAKVIYIPGNHDEFLRNYYGTHFGGIDVVENAVHTAVDGKRFLVIHGDIFDLVVQNARWLAHLGDKAYDFAIQMNRFVNFFRRMFGVPYWSLSQWAKQKVKNAVNYIGAFETALAAEARRHGADGVICGHIHYAVIRDEHGIRYMNCGDWVESCTALVEHEDGHFEIITWSDLAPRAAPVPQIAPARAA